MYKSLLKSLRAWNESNTERVKLQHAYIAAAITAIVVAGLVGLVNYDLGQRLTAIALLVLGVFFVNLIAWTLLSGLVLASLDAPSTRQSLSKKSTTKKRR